MFIKKIFIFFIIFFIFNNFAKSQEIFIVGKIDNEIITNLDVEIEKKYLLLLNERLNSLNEKEFFKLAKNSLIREKIKRKEVNKSFKKRDDKIKNKIVKNFYTKLGFNKKNDFIKFLDTKEINFENLQEKLITEAFWNQLIFIKFKNRIRIDKNSIEKDIINYYNSRNKKYEFNLSEIVIDIEKDIDSKKKKY